MNKNPVVMEPLLTAESGVLSKIKTFFKTSYFNSPYYIRSSDRLGFLQSLSATRASTNVGSTSLNQRSKHVLLHLCDVKV